MPILAMLLISPTFDKRSHTSYTRPFIVWIASTSAVSEEAPGMEHVPRGLSAKATRGFVFA